MLFNWLNRYRSWFAMVILITGLVAGSVMEFGSGLASPMVSSESDQVFRASPLAQATQTFNLQFSTYLGGNNEDYARDIFVDGQGNVYVTGGTLSTNFPITTGPAFNNNSCPGAVPSFGAMEAFVTKYSPGGNIIWSRFVGGPCYDRAYAIEVDAQGYVYIAGRAGQGFPVTPGALQTSFQGVNQGSYGDQNAFVAKLKPNGDLAWATYVGVGQLARDLAVDNNGDIYIPLTNTGMGGSPPAQWFQNAYQKDPRGGYEAGAAKIQGDGTRVIWATWLGGTGDEAQTVSVRVDLTKTVYLAFSTGSHDIPTTPGAFDSTYNGGKEDGYVAHLSADGSSLLFATFLGGSGNEFLNTHNLALDNQGNAYVSYWTSSTNYPTTVGALQRNYAGGNSDVGISKLSPSGDLLASTYLGGGNADNIDGMYIDSSGQLYMTGMSSSANFPITPGALQAGKSGQGDTVVIRMQNNLSQLLYSTFLGGASDENGRTGFIDAAGNLYIAGTIDGAGWPVKNAVQSNYAGGPLDAVVARLDPSNTIPPDLDKHDFLPLMLNQKHVSVQLPGPTQSIAANTGCFHTTGQP